jgi:hypothetical protein
MAVRRSFTSLRLLLEGRVVAYALVAFLGIVPPALANRFESGLDAMPNAELKKRLGAIVNSAEYRCDAKRTFKKGVSPYDGVIYYLVECASGRLYQVSIGSDVDGSTSVLDCAVAKKALGFDCTKPWRR